MKNTMNILNFLLAPLFANLFRFATGNPHIVQQFNEVVMELAGGPNRAILKEAIGFKGGTNGDTDWIDGISPANDAGRVTANAAVTGRQEYDALGAPTVANFVDYMLTADDAVNKQRTEVTPVQIEVSKWFKENDRSFMELTDPTSRTVKALMSGYFLKQDTQALIAMLGGSMQRKTTANTTTHAENFPAAQVVPSSTYAALDWKIFSAIKKRFLAQYLMGDRIWFGIGPTAWEALVNNSGDKLVNKDYVDSGRHFDSGELPTVFGVTPLVHPLFEDMVVQDAHGLKDDADHLASFCAWSENGLVWDEWSSTKANFKENMTEFKGQSVARIACYGNATRPDDKLVVQGKFVNP